MSDSADTVKLNYVLTYKGKRKGKVLPSATISAFVNLLLAAKESPHPPPAYCEIFRGDTLVKPFYDWDLKVDCENDIARLKVTEQDALEAAIEKLHPDVDIAYADRSGWNAEKKYWKVSLRAFVQGIKMRVSDIPIHIKSTLGDEKPTQLDIAVYKTGEQLLGCIYCQKNADDPRVLTPEENDLDAYGVRAYIVQDVAECKLVNITNAPAATSMELVLSSPHQVTTKSGCHDLSTYLDQTFHVPSHLILVDSIKISSDRNLLFIPTISHRCPFKGVDHKGNHVKFHVKMRKHVALRCHDEACKTRESTIKWAMIPYSVKQSLLAISGADVNVEPETVEHATTDTNALTPAAPTSLSLTSLNRVFSLRQDIQWLYEKEKLGYHLISQCKDCLVTSGEYHENEGHSWVRIQDNSSVSAVCISCGERKIRAKDAKIIVQQFNQIVLNIFPDADDTRTFVYLRGKVTEDALTHGLQRGRGNGIIYAPHNNLSYAMVVRWEDPSRYVNNLLKSDNRFHESPKYLDELLKWIKNNEHPDFPYIENDHNLYGFRNGVLDIRTNAFSFGFDEPKVVRRFYDCDYAAVPTPLWDSIITSQLPEDAHEVLLCLLGRLLFKVGQMDNWQIMPLIVGESGTGKSTILKVLMHLFARVGNIDDHFDHVYGLASLYETELVICDDLPRDIKNRLPQQSWQKMVTGSLINVRKAYGDPRDVVWDVHQLWAGNWVPNYVDMGQVGRRLVVFQFNHILPRGESDTRLEDDIVASELVGILQKILFVYHRSVAEHGRRAFYDWCPDYFHHTSDEMRAATNPLFRFLRDEDWVLTQPDGETPVDAIRDAFQKYLKKPVSKKLDRATFLQANPSWVVTERKVCGICSCPGGKRKRCCDRYDPKRRISQYYVPGLTLVDRL